MMSCGGLTPIEVETGLHSGDTQEPLLFLVAPGNESALRRLRERLRDSSAESAAVRADDDLPPEVRYYFPNVDGGEMWSRWDMQETPPISSSPTTTC